MKDLATEQNFPTVSALTTLRERAAAVLRVRRPDRLAIVEFLLLLVATALFALHFVHLSADFPNHSPWMDWAKYTDEGWYGDAAIRQVQRGQWYVPGDFNPAVALPVWPLLEFGLFSITGASIVAARALTVGVFGLILIASYLLLRRTTATKDGETEGRRLAPAVAVVLLAASPFCYAFSRMAILEPLLILLTLLALLAASMIQTDPIPHESRGWRTLRRHAPSISLGVLIPLMVLTKTTAVFLLPLIVWMLWASSGYKFRPFAKVAVPAGLLAGSLWSTYFFLVVRPHFLEDYRYLFSANSSTGLTRENALEVLRQTFADGVWMGELLYPLALAATILSLVFFRRSFRNGLVPSLLLWIAGYTAFLIYHNNLQPRYYLVVAVPMTLLVPVVFEELLRGTAPARPQGSWVSGMGVRGAGIVVAMAAFALVVCADASQTIEYVRSPEYTFASAARELRGVVLADRAHSPLVLSISGSDLSLMTGLPSICDDYGTMRLEDRVGAYRPGWFATWNDVEDDKMEALAPYFHLERVAEFPAMDDPERNLLILYRLDPPRVQQPMKQRRKPSARLVETSLGMKSASPQLEH